MGDVIHRTTLEFRPSVNMTDFPEPTWKWHPDMTGVDGVPHKYWKAPADWGVANAGPVEMTAGEKTTKDADLQSEADDDQMTEIREYVYALKRRTRIEIQKNNQAVNDILAHLRDPGGTPIPDDINVLTATQFNTRIRTQLEGL